MLGIGDIEVISLITGAIVISYRLTILEEVALADQIQRVSGLPKRKARFAARQLRKKWGEYSPPITIKNAKA